MSDETNANFIQILKPFLYVDLIFSTQGYNINENNIEPLSIRNIISLVVTNLFFMISYCIIHFTTRFENEYDKSCFLYLNLLYIALFGLTSVVNVYYNTTMFTLTTYLKNGDRTSSKDILELKLMAWFSSFVLILFYIAAIFLKILQEGWLFVRHFIIVVGIVLEMKLLNIACMIQLLTRKMKTWTNKVLKCKDLKHCKERERSFIELKEKFQALFTVYDLIKKSSNLLILYQLCMSFFQLLMYITILVRRFENAKGSRYAFSIHVARCTLWFLQGWSVQSFLGFSFETFYAEVASMRANIFNDVCTEDEGEFKQFSKNIARSIDINFNKMTACGLSAVDMDLPVCFWNLAANYIVFILTFSL